MKILEITDGIIAGTSTLKVVLPYVRRNVEAPNLNVIIPRDELPAIGLFLHTMGYRWKSVPVARVLSDTVEACFLFRHPQSRQFIFVTESTRPTVLNVLVESKNTAAMNAITARNIYSLYPALTASGNAFSSRTQYSVADGLTMALRWGLHLRDPTMHPLVGDRECGYECPRRFRKMQGGGIGMVCWNRKGMESVVLSDQRVSWNLSDYCLNVRCRDREPELYHGW